MYNHIGKLVVLSAIMLMVNYYECSYLGAGEKFQIPTSSIIVMLLITIAIWIQLYVKFPVSIFMKHEGEITHHQQN
jgi:hypothetical protein